MPSKESKVPEIVQYQYSKKGVLATTRFSQDTWNENCAYLKTQPNLGCIYPVPEPNGQHIPVESHLFILEMNNTQNRIMGIGLVKNKPIYNKYRVYTTQKYNEFAYVGKYRIDRSQMNEMEERIMKFFDIFCFKGSRHLKRLLGVKAFPSDILYKCRNIMDLVDFIATMFKSRF
jgi:hypothetical protein